MGAVEVSDEVGATAEAFARLALELHGERGVTETAEAVVRFALTVVGCGCAGLIVTSGGPFQTAAVTHPLIELSDQLQLDSGTGPAFSVIADGHDLLVVSDSSAEQRWPAWSTGLAELGLRSALLVRLGVRDQTFGVLQLFDRRPDAFGREDEEVAEVLARHASIAVASAQQEASLWREADARKQVGQAQGILMERYGIDAQQAFGMLRQYSQENNTKLREIADQLTRDRRAPVSKQGGLSVPSWAESFVFGLTPWRIRCSSRPAQERNRSSLSVVCCWPQRCCRPWSPGCSSVGRCRPRPVPSRPGRRLSS
jgi:transcriptional regulator with GAF, ATPase, and Fis domain